MTADLLRRAADRLDEVAKTATSGPWQIEYTYSGDTPQGVFVECPDGQDCELDHGCYDGTLTVGGMEEPGDNVWACLMGPQVAAPLAAWLRVEADLADNPMCVVVEGAAKPLAARVPATAQPFALALARAILGEQPDNPPDSIPAGIPAGEGP